MAAAVTNYQLAMKTDADSYIKLFKDSAGTLTTQQLALITTQSNTAQQAIKDVVAMFQTTQGPAIVQGFAKQLQDIVSSTQADM